MINALNRESVKTNLDESKKPLILIKTMLWFAMFVFFSQHCYCYSS